MVFFNPFFKNVNYITSNLNNYRFILMKTKKKIKKNQFNVHEIQLIEEGGEKN